MNSKDEFEDDSDLDGEPLGQQQQQVLASLAGGRKSSAQESAPGSSSGGRLPAGFMPSKWETVDQKTVESQAVTSKWDLFDQQQQQEQQKNSSSSKNRNKSITEPDDDDDDAGNDDDDDDIDGVPLQEGDDSFVKRSSSAAMADSARLADSRRAKIREIELKVMCYQDELESGKVPTRPGWTLSEQVKSK